MRQTISWKELSSAAVSALGVVLTIATLISTPAEARRHYYRFWHPTYRQVYRPARHVSRFAYSRPPRVYRQNYQPTVAAMVVDDNTGRTLYASNEDQLRHPASITKVMTLYLLFEQMEKGRLQLDSEIPISAHAAAQPPTKLGLPPGATIRVEDAIKAIVTESANDIAVAVAEAIGGDESHFAAMMTEKARALGMTRTFYANASGLPNDQQITTARDLIVLGRAIQNRFPREYAFFSTRVFYFDGRAHANHNHLLGRIEGMDGIKTGYTRASGFNLLTSVRRDGRHIVSVVLGGTTARGRDRIMADLVERNLELASADGRGASMVAERSQPEPVQVADAAPTMPIPRPQPAYIPREVEPARSSAPASALREPPASAPPAQATAPGPRPRLAVVSGAPRAAQADQTGSIAERRHIVIDGSTTIRTASAESEPTTTSGTLRWVAGPAPAARYAVAKPLPTRTERVEAAAAPAPARVAATTVARSQAVKPEPAKLQVAENTVAASQAPAHAGWMIQIGATDDAGKANDLLTRARSQDHAALASAQPFTEKVQKGEQTLYRARFAGLEPNQAEAACKMLKRSGFDCFATMK